MNDVNMPAAANTAAEEGWKPALPSPYTDLIGDILVKRKDGARVYGFRIEGKHDNSTGRAHGGLIMSFCDEAMGIEAHDPKSDDIFFTVNFECQFISGAMIGEFLELTVERSGAGRSIVFMRGTCRAGDRLVATCTGVWKRSSKKYAKKD